MPVTLISSNAACSRTDRLPGVAVAWRDGAPTDRFRARPLAARRKRLGVGSEGKRSVFGLERDWRSRAREGVFVLGGGVV
jgi:hypothetical protein